MTLEFKPSDLSYVDLSPVDTAPEFIGAFRYCASHGTVGGPSVPEPLGRVTDDLITRANATVALWQATVGSGAAMMIACQGNRLSIVSRRGGLIVEARPAFNIGMLRNLAKAMALAPMPRLEPAQQFGGPQFAGPGDRAVWAIAERLGRIEASRVIEMTVGEAEYILRAHKSGFEIVDDPKGAKGMVAAIRFAAERGQDIEFTYGDGIAAGATTHHRVHELFAAERGDALKLNSAGWPIAMPETSPEHGAEGLSAPALLARIRIAAHLSDWADPAQAARVDLIGANGLPMFGVSRSADPASAVEFF